MFLTSKLVSCFVDGFNSIMKSRSIAHLLLGIYYIYIGFQSFKVKSTQYGIWSSYLQECKGNVCLKSGEAGNNFWSGSKNSREGCPRPDLTPPKVRAGCLMFAVACRHQCLRSFWAHIVGQDPSDSKTNQLHVDIFRFCFIHLRYIPQISKNDR